MSVVLEIEPVAPPLRTGTEYETGGPCPAESSPVDCQPNIEHLATEDETPADNLPSEKNQRMLIEPLHGGWSGPGEGRTFLAAANVGVFYMTKAAPVVPDVFVSMDVEIAEDWWAKEHRSYFLWEFGKSPEAAIEIVSNTESGEDEEKLKKYARLKVTYYVIYDPMKYLSNEILRVYELEKNDYRQLSPTREPATYLFDPKVIPLGLTLWEGEYEGKRGLWLRWTDEHGNLIPTGKERAEAAEARLEQERTEKERERAEKERLLAKLRELGIDPDAV